MARKKTEKQVTASELIVLQVLWNSENPMTIAEINEEIQKKEIIWAYRTVSSFINSLEKKGVVAGIKEKITFYYYPIIKKDDFNKIEAKRFLNTYFSGSIKGFLSAFTGNKDISEDEIKDVKEWIDKF